MGNVTKHSLSAKSHLAVVPLAQNSRQTELPPVGVFTYTPIKINQPIYAMRSSLLSPWGRGRILRVNHAFHLKYISRGFFKINTLLLKDERKARNTVRGPL